MEILIFDARRSNKKFVDVGNRTIRVVAPTFGTLTLLTKEEEESAGLHAFPGFASERVARSRMMQRRSGGISATRFAVFSAALFAVLPAARIGVDAAPLKLSTLLVGGDEDYGDGGGKAKEIESSFGHDGGKSSAHSKDVSKDATRRLFSYRSRVTASEVVLLVHAEVRVTLI